MSRRSGVTAEQFAAAKAKASWTVRIFHPRRLVGESNPTGRCLVCAAAMPSNGGIRLYCSKSCRRRRHNRRAA